MKKLKKVLCFVIPIVLIVAITLGVVIPLCVNRGETKIEKTLADETGAGTASMSDKGGAIYVESGGRYTHNGGTISGKSKMYGGAVFVASGGHFTMESGEISGCSAKYGGAIYVANGGECIINGGTITKNKAEVAPAIYVEKGGSITISGESIIKENTIAKFIRIGPEETVGSVSSSLKLKTTTFGTFPQTYVGDSMNTTLENWYSGKAKVKTYTIRGSQVWDAYEYTDGELYARGKSLPYDTIYKYENGTTIKSTGAAVWFKVEPIKWYILNYDAWKNGGEDIELLSELALTSYVRFDDSSNIWSGSELQMWLNGNFYNTAFDEYEKDLIKKSEVKNNITGDYNSSTSDGKGTTTSDYIYCKSYWEMYDSDGVFKNDANRHCSPTDFALSNNCYMPAGFSTGYRAGTCSWWLRSAGSPDNYAFYVYIYTGGFRFNPVDTEYHGVRPALHLNLSAQ